MFLSFNANANINISFIGINDKVLDYKYGTEPVLFSGAICVPYTVFSRDVGISTIYSAERQILTLYDVNHIVTIDVASGTIHDENLNSYNGPVFFRGNQIYVPAQVICGIFNLNYSVINSDVQTIRISNSSAKVSDEVFKTLADVAYNNLVSVETPPVQQETKPAEQIINVGNIKPIFVETIVKEQIDAFNDGQITYYVSKNSFENSELVRYAYIKNNSIGIYVPSDTENVEEYISQINDLIFKNLGFKTRLIYTENEEQMVDDKNYSNLSLNYKTYNLTDITKSSMTTISVNLTQTTNFTSFLNFCNTNNVNLIKIDEFN